MQSTDLKEVTMFRLFTRIGGLAAVVVAALAFSGSALAAPTTPHLFSPSGPNVFGPQVTFSWTASTFDNGAFPTWYRLSLADITPNQPVGLLPPHDTFGTSLTFNLSLNHRYSACVRANEVLNGQQSSSLSSCRAFWVLPAFNFKELYYEVVKWPPDPPWCLTCPIWDLHFDDQPDPRTIDTIEASRGYDAAQVSGIAIYENGDARLMYGR
jgi:hypothetical protein